MMRNLAIAAIISTGSMFAPGSVYAGADAVFSRLDGSFRGSGFAITNADGKKSRVTCQLTNSYDAAARQLKMKGRCASTQGASNVNGTLSHAGSKISGNYLTLRPNFSMTRSSGKAGGKSLTLNTTFVDKTVSKTYKIRQIIQITSAGFQADFYSYDNKTKKYEAAGVIGFRRK
ncbi:MAG: hypothetical protein L3J32_05605 [Rhizobiaceae bacterium]|nr:hypothetical protein [Rhizobiaceae bacterium]